MKNITYRSIGTLAVLLLGGILGATALSANATNWTGPQSAPPICLSGNPGCDAPINVGSTTQWRPTGLLGIGNLVVGNLTFANGSPTVGQVMTAVDTQGDVGWGNGGGGSGSTIVFVTPTTLATIPTNGGLAWTTISNLASYGVPSNATAVMLSVQMDANGDNGPAVYLYERANSSSPTYNLAAGRTAGGGSPNTIYLAQGLYPISSSGTFDYKADGDTGNSVITLVGYLH